MAKSSNHRHGRRRRGQIGRKHIDRIKAHPDFELAGIADVNATRWQRRTPTRASSPIISACSTRPGPRVISPSPNQLHASIGIDCAGAACILVEKPVTDTPSTPPRRADRRGQEGRRALLVGHHRRHHRQVRELQTLLRAGRIRPG